jgi:hypothetical protein
MDTLFLPPACYVVGGPNPPSDRTEGVHSHCWLKCLPLCMLYALMFIRISLIPRSRAYKYGLIP